jgi:NADP-dependent 3-hydroxy acid dehydrogenase YdfG
MSRDIDGAVVVVTGASSGIGRRAAQLFAEQHAYLVLAARGEADLEQAAGECETTPERIVTVVTDVRHEEQVQRLARRAIERFGRVDVWVNCAGVIAYGPFEKVPSEVFRAVIDTNLMGQVNGSRAALVEFRRQGQGTLINVASVWAGVTTPDVSAYVTSKFAIRAFTECLRQELADTPDTFRSRRCCLRRWTRRSSRTRPTSRAGGRARSLRCSPPTRSHRGSLRARSHQSVRSRTATSVGVSSCCTHCCRASTSARSPRPSPPATTPTSPRPSVPGTSSNRRGRIALRVDGAATDDGSCCEPSSPLRVPE